MRDVMRALRVEQVSHRRVSFPLPSAAPVSWIRNSLHSRRASFERISDPETHWNYEFASVLSNPKFAPDSAAKQANFGFGTLVQVSLHRWPALPSHSHPFSAPIVSRNCHRLLIMAEFSNGTWGALRPWGPILNGMSLKTHTRAGRRSTMPFAVRSWSRGAGLRRKPRVRWAA